MRGRPPSLDALVGTVTAAAVGVLVGTLGTFKHHAGVSALTGAGVPYGLVLSLAMVAAVLLALRVAFGTRRYAASAGVGVVAAVVVFGLPGPGGSQVVLPDLPGLLWRVGPALIGLLVVLPPGRRRAEPADGDGILDGPAKEEDPAP